MRFASWLLLCGLVKGPYLARRKLRFQSRLARKALLVDQIRDFAVAEHYDGQVAARVYACKPSHPVAPVA